MSLRKKKRRVRDMKSVVQAHDHDEQVGTRGAAAHVGIRAGTAMSVADGEVARMSGGVEKSTRWSPSRCH